MFALTSSFLTGVALGFAAPWLPPKKLLMSAGIARWRISHVDVVQSYNMRAQSTNIEQSMVL